MSKKRCFKMVFSSLLAAVILTVPAYAGMGRSSGNTGGAGNEMGPGSMDNPSPTLAGMKAQETAGKAPFGLMHRVATGKMKDGGVKLQLEPHSFENGVFRVKFFANTHSINLGDYDLMELMHLEFENVGYRPVSMDRMRGHHAGGEIRFRGPDVPEHFQIIVRGLPNMENRVLNGDIPGNRMISHLHQEI